MGDAPLERAPLAPLAPSGTLTFLFTDIEGSTQRWERDRAAMQAAVRRHDELVRAAIESHGGVVFKTVGDAFYSVFELAPSAARAALGVQRAIREANFDDVGGLAVRIALHTGNADEREGDYFGPTLNRVARLLSTGHGGQTLLSGVTAGLLDGQLPSASVLDDLGMHRLKDLERPEHAYQLSAQGSRREFPALRSLDASPHNLPLQVTSFVERDSDIAEITGLLEEHRLVTLVGSGGVGKTRISLQVAANLIDHNEDGVWFIEFAALRESALVPSTVASNIGVTLAPDSDPISALVASLKSKRMLLILDNCEHIIEAAAALASAITRGCPRVSILSSSRQALGIAGETIYRIPSLLVPNAADAATLQAQDLPTYGALALFAARAKSADSRFKVTDENTPVIADICRRLDGIALAIELAAPRVKMMSLSELRDRLNERFRVLTGGSRDALARQQTLRAAIDWSFDLLNESERQLFVRSGIFVDGFTIESIMGVCNEEGLDELELLERLSSLVDKSLVIADVEGAAARYRLLETTRAYAREKLDAAGEFSDLADRHLRYFYQHFRAIGLEIARRRPQASVDVEPEFENARAAVNWALEHGRYVEGAEIFTATRLFVGLGSIVEVRSLAEQFIRSLPNDEHRLRAKLRLWHVPIETRSAVAEARLSGDHATLVLTICAHVSQILAESGLQQIDEVEALFLEAEVAVGDLLGERLRLLSIPAQLATLREDWAFAIKNSEEQNQICRELDWSEGIGATLLEQAMYERERGNLDRARELAREALPFAEKTAEFVGPVNANVLEFLAWLSIGSADPVSAKVYALRAIAAKTKHIGKAEWWASISAALVAIAYASVIEGQWSVAPLLAGYAGPIDRWFNSDPAYPRQRAEHGRFYSLMRDHFGADELERLLREGAKLTRREAVALATSSSSTGDC